MDSGVQRELFFKKIYKLVISKFQAGSKWLLGYCLFSELCLSPYYNIITISI